MSKSNNYTRGTRSVIRSDDPPIAMPEKDFAMNAVVLRTKDALLVNRHARKSMPKPLLNLCRTLAVQSDSGNTLELEAFILKELIDMGIPPSGITRQGNGNIYVTKGKAKVYPCAVAHTDTVHGIYDTAYIFHAMGNIFAINEKLDRIGTGGDDKVGVWCALQALRNPEVKAMKAAFFVDEEVGCQGSAQASMDFFKNVAFCLQADRRGYGELINSIGNTKLYGIEFSEAIKPLREKYEMKETDGGLTDVKQLCTKGIGIAVANIACGYYAPHTSNETVNVAEAGKVLDFMTEAFITLGYQRWEYKEPVKVYEHRTYSEDSAWENDPRTWKRLNSGVRAFRDTSPAPCPACSFHGVRMDFIAQLFTCLFCGHQIDLEDEQEAPDKEDKPVIAIVHSSSEKKNDAARDLSVN